jgi:trans-aconitate 2-methyltransferase
MTMAWDPAIYSAFAQPRLRPALDMMARIDLADARRVVDLGCGTGNVTRILKERWADADVIGIDSSPEMLMTARDHGGAVRYLQTDAAAWAQSGGEVDILFSNAALHWLDGHHTLFPKLMERVSSGGVLAVQMPHNHYAASHTIMAEAAAAGPWSEVLTSLAARFPVGEPSFYYDLLSRHSTHICMCSKATTRWSPGPRARPCAP